MMQRARLFFGIGLALSIAVVAQAPADERLRVNVFPGPQHFAGLFVERGLAVEIQFTPTSKAQRDALADGMIDIARSAVDNAVAMVEAAGKDVVIVAGGGNARWDGI